MIAGSETGTIDQQHLHQIEQMIHDNQIQVEQEGTQVLVLDQESAGDSTVYLLMPSEG